jgi:hypothetical protein
MRKGIATLLAGAALMVLPLLSGTAAARSHVDVGISFGIPAPVYVVPPAPVYYPAPVYRAPPPVYVAPAPVYYGPPQYYEAPRYYAPPRYYGYDRGGHRGWRHHHRHHD